MRPFLRSFALVVSAAVLIVACGDDDDADGTGTAAGGSTTTTPSVTAAPAADAPWTCVDEAAEEPSAGTEFVWGFGGGTTGEHAMKFIVPAFEKASGLKVSYVGASSAETMGKVIGANGAAGFDIIMQPFAVLQTGRKAGVLHDIDYEALPEMDDIPEEAHDPVAGDQQAVAINQFGYGVAYNTDTLTKNNMPVPTSIDDLFNPVYKDKVGLYAPPYSSAMAQLAVVNQLEKGPTNDWSAGIKKFATLKDRATRYGDQGEIAGAVAKGDVAIWFETTSIANNFKDQGLPIAMVFKPTAPVAYVLAAIPTGSKDKGGPACVFLNWAMSAEGQKLFSENGKNNPVKPGVPAPGGSVMPPLADLELLNVGLLLDNQPGPEAVTEQWNQAFR